MALVETIQAEQACLREALASADLAAERQAHGALGEAFRALGQHDRALPHLARALELARAEGSPRGLLQAVLRMAIGLQYAHRHEAAEPLFEEALAMARQQGFLLDHVLMAAGKCHAERRRWEVAVAAFEEALAIRRGRSTPDAQGAAEEALEAARQALGRGGN